MKPNLSRSLRECLKRASDILGLEEVAAIAGVSVVTLYKWTHDPKHCGSSRTNPLERTRGIVNALFTLEHAEAEQTAVDICAILMGSGPWQPVKMTPAEPDKENLLEEIIDDHPELVAFHQAIQDGAPLPKIDQIKRQLVQEIEETVEAYRRQRLAA